MRISTNEFLLGSLDDLLSQQSRISQLNQQIASGETMLDATADPAGAGLALGVSGQIQHLGYDTANAQSAAQDIQGQLSVLQQVSTLVDQLRQTALQGANAGASATSRQALVTTAQNALQQLVQLANSQAPNGSYLFAGNRANAAPFQTTEDGQIQFAGDAGTNIIEIAPSLTVPVALSGQSVFMNIPAGRSGVAVTASGTNSGSATAVAQGVTSISQVNAERLAGTQFEITFTAGANNTLNYTISSGTGSPGSASFSATSGAVASGAYTAGSDLLFGGVDVRVDGTAAAGDQFVVQTAENSSLFQTAQDLVSALQAAAQPGSPLSSITQQQIQNAIADLDGAQTNILSGQASLGASLAEIQGVQGQNQQQTTNSQVQLTNLQSANLPQVLAKYSESVTALQAAELAFSRIQNLSLFSLIQS
jgi:flagellar hook-associated protein 3 FlgL